MTNDERVRTVSRRLRDLVEPLAANVYFAPEAQDAYKALGLSYIPGYFCSRSACMGAVPGEIVVAAFGVFKPTLVLGAIAEGRQKTTVDDLLAARQRGATAALTRIFEGTPEGAARATDLLRGAAEGATVEGHALHAGLRSLGFPGDAVGDLWRAADLVREHRGDSHVAAWISHDVDAVEITLLTELWWRLPLNSYVRTRGWSEEDIAAAVDRLHTRGLIDDEGFTPEGKSLRASIEEATDRQERGVVEGLGDDAEELLDLLEPWATAIVESGGYPADPRRLTRK